MPFNIPAFDQVTANEHPLLGNSPMLFHGTTAPDGDASPWSTAPVGSLYVRRVSTTHGQQWTKVKDDARDDDWTGVGIITQRIAYTDFTDGGAAAGTKALATQIPQGAWVHRCYLLNVTGFTGDTSAVVIVGDGSTTNRYNTGTPSVFATANAIDLGAVSGTAIHTAAATVTVTVTSNADFTSVSAGAMTVKIFYYI
jgi:hypothetical protein